MTNQTERRPDTKRSARAAKPKHYSRQTAHVEARRDGTPLIFGWGSHLSRNEKLRIQRRFFWSLTIIVFVVIALIFTSAWVNIYVVAPNQPITSVNGQQIPQSDYRKMLALRAQIEQNSIEGAGGLNAQQSDIQAQVDAQQKTVDGLNTDITALQKQIDELAADKQSEKPGLEQQLQTKKTTLTTAQASLDSLNNDLKAKQDVVSQEKVLYTQSQMANESVEWLQDDRLIRDWLNANPNLASQVNPSDADVNTALADFQNKFPQASNYQKFLNDNHLSENDARTMMTVKARRDKMTAYLASLITSPSYQVQARHITLSDETTAKSVLDQLQKGGDFAALAKDKSIDSVSKDQGGDIGWLAQGQYTKKFTSNLSTAIDTWLFDPTRKVNDLSPLITESGTFHIVQITAVDPKHDIDAASLKELKDNALTYWRLTEKTKPNVSVGAINQDMLLDASNMPPGLPSGVQSGQ